MVEAVAKSMVFRNGVDREYYDNDKILKGRRSAWRKRETVESKRFVYRRS